MASTRLRRVALVGCGVIGRGWIRVFARAGAEVTLHDREPAVAAAALDWLAADLAADREEGVLAPEEAGAILGRVGRRDELADALSEAEWVQESAPEDLALKRALFAEMDRLAPAGAILASSTSALDIGAIVEGLGGAARCLMAHPFNPPHLLPAVEMLAPPGGDPAVMERACALLAACGQAPVRMNRYVPGFLGNRLQAALIREALHLVESGVADPLAVDAVLRDGLALRWAAIGNFGANHTNAPGGIADYFARYGAAYAGLMADLDSAPPAFDATALAAVGQAVETREGVAGVAGLTRRRDRLLRRLRRAREEEGT